MNVDFSSFSFIKGNLSSEPIIPEKFPSQELLPLINQKKGGGETTQNIFCIKPGMVPWKKYIFYIRVYSEKKLIVEKQIF